MKIEDLDIYNLSMNFSDKVWNIVGKWDYFAKDTLGKQWVRAVDSIDANISEGFGRYISKILYYRSWFVTRKQNMAYKSIPKGIDFRGKAP